MIQAFTPSGLDVLFDAVPTLEYGAVGREHVWRHIVTALQAADTQRTGAPASAPYGAHPESGADLCGRFAREMLVWALQEDPLDARLLGVAAASSRQDMLAGGIATTCPTGFSDAGPGAGSATGLDAGAGVRSGSRRDGQDRLPFDCWHALAQPPEAHSPECEALRCAETEDELWKALPFGTGRVRPGGGGPLFWLREGLERALDAGFFDLARHLVQAMPDDVPQRNALIARLHAGCVLHALYACGDADMQAHEAFAALDRVTHKGFALWRTMRTAGLLARRGDSGAAASACAGLWRATGFHPNLTLLTHELACPAPGADLHNATTAPAILLYSWNKADLLRQTLESLRATETGASPVFVLDNGSTDATQDVIAAARAWWQPGLFRDIRLPVNVGAPAARNWLLTLPEVRARSWVAFLDDDILLPQGWLAGLWNTAAAHPGAGAVGCTITDHGPPHHVQGADFHLLPQEHGRKMFGDMAERIFVYSYPMGQSDTSMLRYTRPCLHVSGCCHLLNMRALDVCGGFDIRFSPSQFDDLERDIRSCLGGFASVYNGAVRIRHVQHSSLRQARTTAQSGHIHGNKIKLEGLFRDRDVAGLRASMQGAVRDDLKRKTAELHALFGPSTV